MRKKHARKKKKEKGVRKIGMREKREKFEKTG